LGTNPLAPGFPGGQTSAVPYDFATTTVACMKLVTARGTERTVFGSDLGRAGNPLPVERYPGVVGRLVDSGLSESDIRLMTSRNPARLIGLN
jgi:hypothetical protein